MADGGFCHYCKRTVDQCVCKCPPHAWDSAKPPECFRCGAVKAFDGWPHGQAEGETTMVNKPVEPTSLRGVVRELVLTIQMLHDNMRVQRGEKGVKAWDGAFVEKRVHEALALLAAESGETKEKPSEKPTAPMLEIEWQREGRCLWHLNCPKRNGIMREVKREPNRSLLECLNCGQHGYYPVGGSGIVCMPLETING